MTDTQTQPQPGGSPRVFPTLRCRDADAMIDWLKSVLGFTEHVIYRADDGSVAHGELALGPSIVMLGQDKDDSYGKLIGNAHLRRTNAIYITTDDPDAVHARAVASGAMIEMAPYDTSYGSREFACRDPEGNLWCAGSYWPKTHEPPAGIIA